MSALGLLLMWSGWGFGLAAVLTWWKAERHRVAVRSSLLPDQEKTLQPVRPKKLPAWLLRAAESMADRAGSLTLSGDLERWERQLILAGRPYELTASVFSGLRLVLVAFGLLGGNLLALLGFPFVTPVLLSAAGYFGPVLWLQGRAQARQARIGKALPDFLDTVACALEAGGVGLDQAVERTLPYFDGPLSEELGRYQQEIALGTPRRQALERLLNRTACRELEILVQALIQAETIGAPVAQAFNIQAEAIRTQRAQTARDAAAKAETKLTSVGTLVLAPISLVFILALLVLNLFYNPAFSGWRSMW
jgi:tight adherence protein C